MKKKRGTKSGRKPERLKIEGDWKEAIKKALAVKPVKPERKSSTK